jgi:uncharacterized protein DUF4145
VLAMAKEVVPQLGLDSFSCPHCGALAHQFWFNVYPDGYKRDQRPDTIELSEVAEFIKLIEKDDTASKRVQTLYSRFKKNEVTYEKLEYSSNSTWRMLNMFMSQCHACEGFSVWIKDKLIWPAQSLRIGPHPDIPANVKDDFIEAADIVERSPRGSAALSRLVIQKLMVALGEKGENINDDIGSLVKKGLEVEIQQAMDVVRVIGNNAVHPGEIDLKDDAGTALALLQLINLIVERRISTQKRIAEMFINLPPGARDKIAKRDGHNGESKK